MYIQPDVKNLFDISGKKAVVIGGAGGIGKAIAKAFAMNGASVVISSRKEEALKEACEEIKAVAPDVKVLYYACDATDEQAIIAMRDFVVSEEGLGGCDILVNSQGYNKKMFSWEINNEIWDGMIATNITSLMYTCRYFGNWMKENNLIEGMEKTDPSTFEHGKPTPCQGFGKIINIGSVRGIRVSGNGGNGNIAYNTTKGAVEMLTKTFATDLRPNVQVNLIGPTITYTPMMVGLLPADEQTRDNLAAAKPAMRIGREDDLVGTAIYLASRASDFVTGASIYPDGGMTILG